MLLERRMKTLYQDLKFSINKNKVEKPNKKKEIKTNTVNSDESDGSED